MEAYDAVLMKKIEEILNSEKNIEKNALSIRESEEIAVSKPKDLVFMNDPRWVPILETNLPFFLLIKQKGDKKGKREFLFMNGTDFVLYNGSTTKNYIKRRLYMFKRYLIIANIDSYEQYSLKSNDKLIEIINSQSVTDSVAAFFLSAQNSGIIPKIDSISFNYYWRFIINSHMFSVLSLLPETAMTNDILKLWIDSSLPIFAEIIPDLATRYVDSIKSEPTVFHPNLFYIRVLLHLVNQDMDKPSIVWPFFSSYALLMLRSLFTTWNSMGLEPCSYYNLFELLVKNTKFRCKEAEESINIEFFSYTPKQNSSALHTLLKNSSLISLPITTINYDNAQKIIDFSLKEQSQILQILERIKAENLF